VLVHGRLQQEEAPRQQGQRKARDNAGHAVAQAVACACV
jgi:hypothetical protein